jgi:hypothetical protein
VTANSSVICAGQSATLNASGATNYTWNPGNLSGATQTFSPGATQVYTINGANGSCNGVGTTTITITNTLNVGLSTSNNTICSGSSVTLTASGATNYTFNPGGGVSNPAVVTPTGTTTYTVLGTTFGCSGNSVITVTVLNCATGLSSNNGNPIYRIYPNPTSGNVMIEFGSIFTGKVSVFNALGQVLLTKELNNAEVLPLNMSEYAKGIYTIRFSGGNSSETFIKVLKD